ncbi:condensation domain-containing protein, partial [Streptomyces sp. ZEA17I]|uniref:condensation domain-containing protein n=1 Tax=Streptomyces sp. ZEA17I TaxID=2202516 RepID=UPI0015E85713
AMEQTIGLDQLEIIAVNDGSTDGTGEELDRLAALCPSLHVIHRTDTTELVLTGHHLVLDGWSLPLLVREILHGYAGLELPAAPRYAGYRSWLDAQDEAAATEAWRHALSGVTEPTRLIPDDPGEPELPDEQVVSLDPGLTARLAAFARERELTLGTLTRTVWGLVLSAHTGRSDVVFGTVVSGRPADVPDAPDMIGLYVNTVPVRVTLRPEETLTALAARVQDEFAGLLPHQHLGLAAIQRAAGHGVLFDTLTALENYPADPLTALAAATGLPLTEIRGKDATHYPVTFAAVPGERLTLRLDVNLKILLFNNRIYGLTKGQYSPTSELGKITKSTPMGSL